MTALATFPMFQVRVDSIGHITLSYVGRNGYTDDRYLQVDTDIQSLTESLGASDLNEVDGMTYQESSPVGSMLSEYFL